MVHEPVYLEILKYAAYLIAALAMIGVGETLRRLIRIEKKQDEQVETHNQCRMTLLSKADFNDWQTQIFNPWKLGREGPGGLWDEINHHSHKGIEGPGEVIKK
jgi:hypothetical protein